MNNKKSVLLFGIIGSIFFLLLTYSTEIGICKSSYKSCFEAYDKFAEAIFILFPVFLLSLITYKLREEIFQAWLRFSYFWVPLTILLTFLAPEYDNTLVPITKGVVSFWMSAAFFIISLGIVIFKFTKSKNK